MLFIYPKMTAKPSRTHCSNLGSFTELFTELPLEEEPNSLTTSSFALACDNLSSTWAATILGFPVNQFLHLNHP